MLALHFTDTNFILQEGKNVYPYIETELCENVLLEINIGWYCAKFNFKLHFSVNHGTVSFSESFITQYLSSCLSPDVI